MHSVTHCAAAVGAGATIHVDWTSHLVILLGSQRMNAKPWLVLALVSLMTGCGGSAPPSADTTRAPPAVAQKAPERRETVFDPLVGTIDRAKGVQSTVDDQAAEQRRKIEEATR